MLAGARRYLSDVDGRMPKSSAWVSSTWASSASMPPWGTVFNVYETPREDEGGCALRSGSDQDAGAKTVCGVRGAVFVVGAVPVSLSVSASAPCTRLRARSRELALLDA